MRRMLVYAVIVISILSVSGIVLYVSGYQVYQYRYALNAAPSPVYSTQYLESSSGEILLELNITTSSLQGNGTQSIGFGFQLWHAPGFNIKLVNFTLSVGPAPAEVWVSALNYYTDGHPPLQMESANYSGSATVSATAVLTLSGFPPQNPTVLYGVGLTYKNADLAKIGTTVLAQIVLTSSSWIPFVGNTYSGQIGFTLDFAGI